MVEEMQDEGIEIIQRARYWTNKDAVEECLQDYFQDSPEVLKYAAKYII